MENIGQINDGKVDEPAEFLWGMKDLDRSIYDVRFINAPRFGKRTGIRRFTWIFEVVFAKYVRIGLPIDIYLKYKKDIVWADEIVCTYDQVSIGILFWRLFGFLRKKKIHAIVMSLSERIVYFKNIYPLKWFVSLLLRQADTILTLSDVASQAIEKEYGVERTKIYTWYFGIDIDFWKSKKENMIYDIMSIGNDMNRDFETLISAISSDDKVVLVTKKNIRQVHNDAVTVLSGIENTEVRELYNKSRIIVIPSIALKTESAGLSCFLQALSCERPVIISDSPPFREIFKDGMHCLFYIPGSVDDLRKKIELLKNDEKLAKKIATQGYELVRNRYTCKDMSNQLDYLFKHR